MSQGNRSSTRVAGGTAATAAPQRLIAHIVSCWRTQALHTAVQLDIPDHLADGPRDVIDLARICACSSDALHRLLRALCSLGVLRELRNGHFELTTTGALLRRAPPHDLPSLRSLVIWWGGSMWMDWGDLTYSIRSGRSARAGRSGHANDGFVKGQPDTAGVFHEAMRGLTAWVCDDVARLALWRDARQMVDVGGGMGELACALVVAHPRLRAIVFDRPDAEPHAMALFTRRDVASRVRYVAGDFFEAIPEGADCYVLKSILHNWNDVDCRRILMRCAEATRKGARLILIERLRPARLRASRHDEALARADLNMLIGLDGRERALAEFDAMLKATGFAIVSTSPTRHEFSVIQAERR